MTNFKNNNFTTTFAWFNRTNDKIRNRPARVLFFYAVQTD